MVHFLWRIMRKALEVRVHEIIGKRKGFKLMWKKMSFTCFKIQYIIKSINYECQISIANMLHWRLYKVLPINSNSWPKSTHHPKTWLFISYYLQLICRRPWWFQRPGLICGLHDTYDLSQHPLSHPPDQILPWCTHLACHHIISPAYKNFRLNKKTKKITSN